jgi:hypothetical protein
MYAGTDLSIGVVFRDFTEARRLQRHIDHQAKILACVTPRHPQNDLERKIRDSYGPRTEGTGK